jgi:hypothetical protein
MSTTVWASDQEVAQQIAEVMKISGAMKDYSLSVKCQDGTAWLKGTVASEEQMDTAIQIALASPHVDDVVNQMSIVGSSGALSQAPAPPQPSNGRRSRLASNSNARSARPAVEYAPQLRQPPAQNFAPAAPIGRLRAVPISASAAPSGFANGGAPRRANVIPVSQQPVPIGGGGMPVPAYVPGAGGGVAPASFDQPQLPGYAWPSYASYPNYGGLTYPKQYSPTAWPYIGPFYPYPQVPLGWRKVTLEWDDGWWHLDFKDK